jgi:PAS domain S-box-containing protein
METTAKLNQNEIDEIQGFPAHIVVIVSHDGKIMKTNVVQGRTLGWEPDEVEGIAFQKLIHEDDHAQVNEKVTSLISGKEISINISTRCMHKNGSLRLISWTAIEKEGSIYAMGTDTTKYIETENALIRRTKSQNKLQTRHTTFFEQSILPMGIYSLSGFPPVVNKAWEEFFETTYDQLDGYKFPIWDSLSHVHQGASIEVPAFLYNPATLDKPGKVRWLEAWLSPVKDEYEVIREIAIILKDVTEKIEAQKALVKSIIERKATEEKFQIISDRLSMAVKAGKIGIWEWIPDTNHVFWDETTENIYGYKSGTFPQTLDALNDGIHPEDHVHLWSTIAQALKEKKSYRIDHRIIKKNGAKRWVQESGMAFYDDEGNAYHMMGTVMDITDRIEAETDQKFLSEASELLNDSLDYREILKTLSEHAIKYFCDGVFIDHLLPEGDVKRLMVVHPDPEVCRQLEKIENDFPHRYENNPILTTIITGKAMFNKDSDLFLDQLRGADSDSYFQSLKALNIKSSIRVRLKGRESVLGMITFVTMKDSHKELEKRHVWLSEELAYRASMAFENALIHQSSQEAIRSRDEFLSIASHELKTPLQSLTLQNQMRKRNLDKKLVEAFTPEKLGIMIEADLRHLMRINRLIDDMLDISHIRSGKLTLLKEKIEFCSFVKDVLERFRPQLEAVGCYMTATYADRLISNIDIYRIEQVIVNLLTNAKKYGAGTPIKVQVCKKNDSIQLLVHDQGPGIKEHDTERIFERFERAISSNEVSGLGLGLYISRQIMEQNQGKLFVRSVHGRGSTFIMELPCVED